jgi:hypothetical protein
MGGLDSFGGGLDEVGPSVYDGRVLPAATAVLSGDSGKVMAPRATGASPCGRGLVSAAVLGRCAWLQGGVSGRALGPATRKNTAQVNTIQVRATLFTLA